MEEMWKKGEISYSVGSEIEVVWKRYGRNYEAKKV